MTFTLESISELKEAALRKDVLIPLFKAMDYRDVFHYHGGSLEQGKDITMWRSDEMGERLNYAVVVKTGDINGRASGQNSAGEVEMQIRQCFGSPFRDVVTSENRPVHRCLIVTSGRISKEALNAIEGSLKNNNFLGAVKFISRDKLWELIERYMAERTVWNHLHEARKSYRL